MSRTRKYSDKERKERQLVSNRKYYANLRAQKEAKNLKTIEEDTIIIKENTPVNTDITKKYTDLQDDLAVMTAQKEQMEKIALNYKTQNQELEKQYNRLKLETAAKENYMYECAKHACMSIDMAIHNNKGGQN